MDKRHVLAMAIGFGMLITVGLIYWSNTTTNATALKAFGKAA